jgi:hypothetical protein
MPALNKPISFMYYTDLEILCIQMNDTHMADIFLHEGFHKPPNMKILQHHPAADTDINI